MAKTAQPKETKKKDESKKTFEERLERLEELGDEIRQNDTPLDDAIRAFEEGIKLARALEKDLERIEGRVELLMSGTEAKAEDVPELGLFDGEE